MLVLQEDLVFRETEIIGDFFFDNLESIAALRKLEDRLLVRMLNDVGHVAGQIIEMRSDNSLADLRDLSLDHVVDGLLRRFLQLDTLVHQLLFLNFFLHMLHSI